MTPILIQVTVNWIMMSLIYCLTAMGLTLIYGVMGILNFAHGAFYMLGGYVIYYAFVMLGLPYPAGLVSAFLLIGFLGVLVYRGLLRYFREQIMICLIITVGLNSIFENVSCLIFSGYEKAVPPLTSGIVRGPLGVCLSAERLMIMLAALVLMLALLFFMGKSKRGRFLRAVAEDAEAAMLCGVNDERTFLLGMFIASGLAGIAGALMAPIFSVGPYLGTEITLNSFIVILVGGAGSILGALVGSFVLGLVMSFGSTFLGGDVATMMSFALLILVMVFKPRGLLGGI